MNQRRHRPHCASITAFSQLLHTSCLLLGVALLAYKQPSYLYIRCRQARSFKKNHFFKKIFLRAGWRGLTPRNSLRLRLVPSWGNNMQPARNEWYTHWSMRPKEGQLGRWPSKRVPGPFANLSCLLLYDPTGLIAHPTTHTHQTAGSKLHLPGALTSKRCVSNPSIHSW